MQSFYFRLKVLTNRQTLLRFSLYALKLGRIRAWAGPSSSPDFLPRHWRPCDDTVAIWRMRPASSCIRAVGSANKSIGKLAEFASRSAARFRHADRFRCGIHVGPYLHSRVIVFSRWSMPFARLDAVSSFELCPSRLNCTSENGSYSFSALHCRPIFLLQQWWTKMSANYMGFFFSRNVRRFRAIIWSVCVHDRWV